MSDLMVIDQAHVEEMADSHRSRFVTTGNVGLEDIMGGINPNLNIVFYDPPISGDELILPCSFEKLEWIYTVSDLNSTTASAVRNYWWFKGSGALQTIDTDPDEILLPCFAWGPGGRNANTTQTYAGNAWWSKDGIFHHNDYSSSYEMTPVCFGINRTTQILRLKYLYNEKWYNFTFLLSGGNTRQLALAYRE